MDKLLVSEKIITLICDVVGKFTEQVTYFYKKKSEIEVIEFQPLDKGRGPSLEFVEEIVLALKETFAKTDFVSKVLINVFYEKGPEFDEIYLMENNIYKIRVVIL